MLAACRLSEPDLARLLDSPKSKFPLWQHAEFIGELALDGGLRAVVRAAESARAAGVPLMVHYIIGLPGESAEEINGTLRFAMNLYEDHGAWPAVQYATPLPGTGLAKGRALPVVDDWGPRFQTAPSQPDAAVSPELLERFRNLEAVLRDRLEHIVVGRGDVEITHDDQVLVFLG